MSDKLLHIYINDHLAGATAGIEVAKRCLSNNRGTPLGDFLDGFLSEIIEDRATTESVLAATGGKKDPIKPALGWFAEKVGRLKLNGQIRGYSPLSRVEELEGLSAGVEAKRAMWMSFQLLNDPRISGFDFDQLDKRGARQREGLETFRREAAEMALG
jgi:hypothetical protein